MTCSWASVILAILLAQTPVERPCQGEVECRNLAETLWEGAAGAAAARKIPLDLFLAQAWVESRFHPDAVGGDGELGLWQLHPQEYWGRVYRDVAKAMPVVRVPWNAILAANLLRLEWRRCKTWRGALAAYNKGRCDDPRGLKYADRVLRARAWLRSRDAL